jgi:hypothetical protein
VVVFVVVVVVAIVTRLAKEQLLHARGFSVGWEATGIVPVRGGRDRRCCQYGISRLEESLSEGLGIFVILLSLDVAVYRFDKPPKLFIRFQ